MNDGQSRDSAGRPPPPPPAFDQLPVSNAPFYAQPATPPAAASPTSPDEDADGQTRWGLLDAILSIPVILLIAIAGALLAFIIAALAGVDLSGEAELPVYGLVISALVQQAGQAWWPWFVSRRKGFGIARDWRFTAKPIDLALGLMVGVICLIGAGLMTQGMSALVGLEDPDDASNTDILSDNSSSLWVIGIVISVVIAAPLTEELLFRGLLLRIFEKSYGTVAAVIGSTVFFALPHIVAGASWDERIVLWSAIATIGLILALATVKFGRLGPAIIAHIFFNTVGTIVALSGS